MAKPVIFHVDVNSAFLSWTALKKLEEDPKAIDLRNIPSAVGGDVKTRHGIITARSIPAKKYGIHTADPVVKALEKCPNLVMERGDFATYRRFSHALMDILESYANAVEQVSIDEAYLDMTGIMDPVHIHSPKYGFVMQEELEGTLPGAEGRSGDLLTEEENLFPLNIADALRNEVYHTLGFTVNVGISENRLLAKMASDFRKPGRIHTLWPEEIPDKMWTMPIGDLYGCGKKSAARLYDFGIRTIGEAAKTDRSLLSSIMGEKGGAYILQAANGIGSSEVTPEREDAKSYSNETTVSNDITYENYDTDAVPVIHKLAESVSRRLIRDGVYAGTVDISVKTDDFKRYSRQMRLPQSANDAETIETYAQRLARKLMLGQQASDGLFAQGKKVRLIGVGGSNLDDGSYRQMDLFGFMQEKEQQDRFEKEEKLRAKKQAAEEARQTALLEKRKRLEEMMSKVQSKFGTGAIHKGE